MIVLDASALLAVLHGEAGAENVAWRMNGAAISAVNLSEVAARLIERGATSDRATTILDLLSLDIHPFDAAQAHGTAALKSTTRTRGLSFGDRACLALASTLDATILTADRAWSGLERVELIR